VTGLLTADLKDDATGYEQAVSKRETTAKRDADHPAFTWKELLRREAEFI